MSLKKKMGAAMLTTAMGAALIGGGTFALFTADATNAGNTVTTGTLTLQDITNGNGSAAFTVTNMAPGDNGNATVKIKNTGSLDAWVAIDSAADTGDLAPVLDVTTPTAPVIIKAGESADFTVNYSLQRSAGNEYQGKSAALDVKFKAVQSKNNGDTNGNGAADAGEAPGSWNENGL